MIKFPPSRILVPLDFSELSLTALENAKDLARRFGSSLDLVYVQTMPLSLDGFQLDGGAALVPGLMQQMDDFRRWREDKMRQALSNFPASRAKVRSLLGWPPVKIANLASGRGPDLVVMGTHGYGGLDRALFGSVAEAVVRRAEVPVLTTHPTAKLRMLKILVPCNMEGYADKALAYAIEWGRRLGSRVGVLYVAPNSMREEYAKKLLANHLETVLGKKVAGKLDIFVRHGDPRQEILESAARGKFDLIVISAHRKPVLSEFVLGSTAERILRHSPIPVLSIPSVESRSSRSKKSVSKRWITNKIY